MTDYTVFENKAKARKNGPETDRVRLTDNAFRGTDQPAAGGSVRRCRRALQKAHKGKTGLDVPQPAVIVYPKNTEGGTKAVGIFQRKPDQRDSRKRENGNRRRPWMRFSVSYLFTKYFLTQKPKK